MRAISLRLALVLGAAGLAALPARAQVIGSYDNFDVFNDTGETAEGFEIDVQDASKSDLTRTFPSNFSATPWVIRYGLPTVTEYDWTVNAPDAEHTADAGHKGVLITWAATWNGTKWVATYGSQPFGATAVAGDGTPYVANPTLTNGDSCWYYGLGNAYPTSGCDHFGISFSPGATPGVIAYHWKLPDPANPGHLHNGALEASLPPSPRLYYAGANVVHAEAHAPENEPNHALNPDAQYGTAYWVKVTTFAAAKRAKLDLLQKKFVRKALNRSVHWSLLQRPPRAVEPKNGPEREDVEDDAIPAGDVQVTKQYEYFAFQGAYDPEDHSVLCNPAVNCKKPTTTAYNALLHKKGGSFIAVPNGDLGAYEGAHVNADNAF